MKRSLVLYVIMLALLVGCDQDPFGFNEKEISGNYLLEIWEDGSTYYIIEKGVERDGGGVIDGTVLEIGWSEDFIIAKRYANFRGDLDGWMIVDVRREAVEGPFTDEAIKTKSQAQGMDFMSAQEAWEKL